MSHHGSNNRQKEEDTTMKKFGFASIIASGLAEAVLGLAAPAQADLGHNTWVHQIGPSGDGPPGRYQRAPQPLTDLLGEKGHPHSGAPFSFAAPTTP